MEIDVGHADVEAAAAHIASLVHPSDNGILDASIGTALWFAARGVGTPRHGTVVATRAI